MCAQAQHEVSHWCPQAWRNVICRPRPVARSQCERSTNVLRFHVWSFGQLSRGAELASAGLCFGCFSQISVHGRSTRGWLRKPGRRLSPSNLQSCWREFCVPRASCCSLLPQQGWMSWQTNLPRPPLSHRLAHSLVFSWRLAILKRSLFSFVNSHNTRSHKAW